MHFHKPFIVVVKSTLAILKTVTTGLWFKMNSDGFLFIVREDVNKAGFIVRGMSQPMHYV